MINEYIQKNGITKYQFSKMCNLPYSTVNDLCSGKTSIPKCTGETLFKIAVTLGCTVDELLQNNMNSIYNLEKIKKTISPIAKKYNLKSVYVFGSYARKEANENSDIDILIDREGSKIHGILDMSNLLNEMKEKLGKEVDLVTLQSLQQSNTIKNNSDFVNNVLNERVKIYG